MLKPQTHDFRAFLFGSLLGDVKAAALDIETGAVFSGRSEMNMASLERALPAAIPAKT